jgi:hypothetical protein
VIEYLSLELSRQTRIVFHVARNDTAPRSSCVDENLLVRPSLHSAFVRRQNVDAGTAQQLGHKVRHILVCQIFHATIPPR